MNDSIERLRAARGFVFDLDGTLVLGDNNNKGLRPLPGAVELTQHLDKRGIPIAILTNGTTRPPQAYAEMLRGMGFAVRDERMLTPSAVAAEYLAREGFKRVLALGGEGVQKPLADAGLDVTMSTQNVKADEKFDAVFVGWFREFTFTDLEKACNAAWNGAKIFSASLAPFFATTQGRTLSTSRAICAVVTSITGAEPTVLGKPSLEALQCASRRTQIDCSQLVVVGDDPSLEIAMAHAGGSLGVAVHTGVGHHDSYDKLPAEEQPHIAVQNAQELLKLYVG